MDRRQLSEPTNAHHQALPAPAGRNRVLLVDDSEDTTEILGEFIQDLGCEIETAHDGPSALRVAETFKPNVCLVDISIPVMDGYELARRLRASNHLPKGAKIVALTGHDRESDRQRSMEAGFCAHLVKPVDLDELARTVSARFID